jgi:phytoene dehydrogenase-like protein
MTERRECEVVVIGAGVGGLVSAALLARRGVDVLLIESQSKPGGYAVSFTWDGVNFDACIDSVSGLRLGQPMRLILDEIGVGDEVEFEELNPIRRNIFPDFAVDVSTTRTSYEADLSSKFPAEAGNLATFFDAASRVYRWSLAQVRMWPEADSVMDDAPAFGKSYSDFAGQFITDAKLKAVLSAHCNFIGTPPEIASAQVAINVLMSYLEGGSFRVVGGISRLAEELSAKIVTYGGRVVCGTPVTKVNLDKGGLTVVTDRETAIGRAQEVVCAMDARAFLQGILSGPGAEEAAARLERIRRSSSFVIVYLLCEWDRNWPWLRSVGFFPDYAFDEMFRPKGFSADRDPFLGVSVIDGPKGPSGLTSVAIHVPADPNTCGGADKAAAIAERAVSVVETVLFPGLRQRTRRRTIADPDVLARRTGNVGGAALGWRQTDQDLGRARAVAHRFENLHFAGHYSGYGGGVTSCAISGKIAADRVVRALGRK